MVNTVRLQKQGHYDFTRQVVVKSMSEFDRYSVMPEKEDMICFIESNDCLIKPSVIIEEIVHQGRTITENNEILFIVQSVLSSIKESPSEFLFFGWDDSANRIQRSIVYAWCEWCGYSDELASNIYAALKPSQKLCDLVEKNKGDFSDWWCDELKEQESYLSGFD